MTQDAQAASKSTEHPRVYFVNGTSKQVRIVFANAGFLQTRNVLEADVVWGRPGSASELEGFLDKS